MARAVTTQRKTINTISGMGGWSVDLLPDPLDDPDQLQDRGAGNQRSTDLPIL